jgi:flagellar biosynthesis/type III secretory pathway protein FliH
MVTVFLNAADLGPVLGKLRPEQKQGKPSPFHFEVDPLLARGTIRIETDSGRLKYDPGEVLARLRQDLCRTALR